MPEVQQATVVVQIEKKGATESELEKELVEKLEDQFSALSGLTSSESFIRPEKAEILLHFKANVNILYFFKELGYFNLPLINIS